MCRKQQANSVAGSISNTAETDIHLVSQADTNSNAPAGLPGAGWAQLKSLVSDWYTQIRPSLATASQWNCKISRPQSGNLAEPAQQASNLQGAAACATTPQSEEGSCNALHPTRHFGLADQRPQQADLCSVWWPSMRCTRRSALRWRFESRGLPKPVKQQTPLEIQLDQFY